MTQQICAIHGGETFNESQFPEIVADIQALKTQAAQGSRIPQVRP